ncbi:hypothetical protein TG4357_03137 [Thalassovita gelatinovora]|uniref:Endonuclease GajA/Old nuclease/RecF-like AAA domain-containing protein n=1 Tax=Thalassovita gelatinovora TaxID=53501 RepID=A0A0P1FI58_THAGE|nr:AAA family ATPase [Thalassovita gelatinovora]QIZ82106.1 AAA family ATPase [Thalassovita gelatinovora]CUH67664.1 hypothetical protein TG4357_03137 [Thalassovita gelatinovora]SEP69801.1 Predicted ATPase [Thalassovita gelatinovora]
MKHLKKAVVHAKNFRGFSELSIDLTAINFVVGDNSSGKTSILHLINAVLTSELSGVPKLDTDLSVGRFDYFSPYFSNDDVTLGFEIEDDSGKYIKIITLRQKSVGEVPQVEKCTYATEKLQISLRRFGKKLKAKKVYKDNSCDWADVCSLHESTTGFSLLKDEENVPPPNHLFAVTQVLERRKEAPDADLIKRLMFEDLYGVRHIAPVRGMPEKFYNFDRKYNASGKHFATMWHDIKKNYEKDLRKIFRSFGRSASLFDDLEISRVAKGLPDSPLIVRVSKNGQEFFLNQVGVGVSQVVPILVEMVFEAHEEDGNYLLFQQPELHLHPVAQAALGDLFFEMSSKLRGMTIETHSNFFIDRFRLAIRNSENGEARRANILYCSNSESGNKCEVIEISNDGRLVDPPYEYFKFFLSELEATTF